MLQIKPDGQYRMQATGAEIVPNVNFWTSLPGLIKVRYKQNPAARFVLLFPLSDSCRCSLSAILVNYHNWPAFFP